MDTESIKTSEPSWKSKIRAVIAFLLGALLALLGFAFWGYRANLGEKSLRSQLENERKKSAAMRDEIAESDRRISALAKDLQASTGRLTITQSNLAMARREVQASKANEVQLAGEHRTFSDPVWNAWAESYSPNSPDRVSFSPQKLQPGKDYSFVLNLAALSYDEDRTARDSGVYSQHADSSFLDWVEKNPQMDTRDVQVLIIPDRSYFEKQLDGQVMKPFAVELAKIRRVRSSGFYLAGSALQYMRTHGASADFNFGIRSFHIKTSSKLGVGSIAVSIWADGLPVNEVSFSVCIVKKLTDACEAQPQATYSLKGVDLSKLDSPPDAALQIIDRQSDVVGVFRCNVCGWKNEEYRIWGVAETEKDFATEVKKIVVRLGKVPKLASPEAYEQRFQAASQALYNVLFGGGAYNQPRSTEEQDEATSALAAFNSVISESKNRVLAGKPPLSLFVRLIPSEHDLVLTPIGLMEVKEPPMSPATVPQGQLPNHLGFYVDIQAPLELQDYSKSTSCLSEWVLLVPPSPDGINAGDKDDYKAVEDARAPFESWITKFQTFCADCVKQDIGLKGFQTWLQGTGAPVGAIVALSHHDDDFGLYFDSSSQDPAIITSDIHRVFEQPAVAILAACGTAEPGGSDFVTKFNAHKVRTVIATSSAVDGAMAGTFLSLLLEKLDKNRDTPSYTLSQARFDAAKILSLKSDSDNIPYGARALEFILAGNGTIRLCPPPDKEAN